MTSIFGVTAVTDIIPLGNVKNDFSKLHSNSYYCSYWALESHLWLLCDQSLLPSFEGGKFNRGQPFTIKSTIAALQPAKTMSKQYKAVFTNSITSIAVLKLP